MCLAIVKPASAVISSDNLRNGWLANPDGGGYAYVKEGKVVISKGFRKLKDFMAAYTEDSIRNANSPFLVHFRICSLGEVSDDNTHPYPIDNGALIHNGTLTGTGARYGTGPSDTKLFSQRYRDALSFDFVQKYKPKWDTALSGSKLCMLYEDGRYQIVNEKDGVWDGGIWYSNRSYLGSLGRQRPWEDEWEDYGV